MENSARHPLARPSTLAIGFIATAAIALIPAAAVFAQPATAPFTVVENGRGFGNLQQAVDSIGNGSGTIAIAPGTYRQCAVQEAGSIAFFASEPGSAVLDGVECEGKAALVLRGREASVSGIVFRNMAVSDFNGAGIRLEAGNLTVANSWFVDSQQGILTAHNDSIRLVVDRSTFSGLGTCEGDGGCAHSIYTGTIGHLRITRSRFERGQGGHYVKSRAARTDIAASSFDDSAGSSTNYMIDMPGGSTGQITNNWFVQGRDKENYSAFIALGAEDFTNTSDGLVIAGNDARFVPSLKRDSTFVADWAGAKLTIEDNELAPGLKRYERR
ncbi:right-handed parallel beta-helix repeat-containing protein [Parerythrobacter jejuensis]|uniref:Right-handed parallel beta-helix repeat-containing protein n=1 Tax=Parerythrobacter jejuensis TaxID=795812 RepID=A0A845ARL1_9SPHN|nr:right-handed parallel beta-helix repeat-containing protein [Parerythrobacter jejuensis]MXP31146.1 right-handed parallel beta-helix repeat-containing protein [Parerythrobacter jejuensis]MXP33906.1 right-handed parallel beta-helix repeat-containing protein [Parerythrobacter jejuensis]